MFFFFQAEDGIRDGHVTGVQTCALPICMTGDSHHRCMVAEVMGRSVGWIALHSGMAAGAHVICLPEFPLTIGEICQYVKSAFDRGRAPLVVVAEGYVPSDAPDRKSTRLNSSHV